MKNSLKLAGALLLALALSSIAQAAPIVGAIEINGSVVLNTGNLGLAKSAAAATGLVLDGSTTIGDFLPDVGSTANYMAFSWNPVITPVNPLWTIADTDGTGPKLAASFDLSTLSITFHDGNNLILHGSGMLHLAGFDPTPGSWTYAITRSDNNHTNTHFGFESNNAATSVPDGGTTALLVGMSLIGLSLMARRRKAA